MLAGRQKRRLREDSSATRVSSRSNRTWIISKLNFQSAKRPESAVDQFGRFPVTYGSAAPAAASGYTGPPCSTNRS